jgi:hypothetical protein
MSKSKIRSMQRGAQKRDRDPPMDMHAFYQKHPPQLSSLDKPHLDFIRFGRLDQVLRIKTVVQAAQKNGIGTASEICKLLNKLMIRTAIGEKWTPRLVWFATSAIRMESHKTGNQQHKSISDSQEVKFQDLVKRVIKSRLEEIRNEFDASKPTLGDVSPALQALKDHLEGK